MTNGRAVKPAMMRLFAVVLSAAVLSLGAVSVAPAAEAAPPDLPPNHGGCDYFHYHNGNLLAGQPPSYHYHPCL